MLSLIPIIGPLIQGLVAPVFTGLTGLLGKYWDSKVETAKVQADVDTTAMAASAKIIQDTEQDWGVRFARDLLIWPPCAWCAIYVWDRTVALSHPQWVVGVLTLDAVPFLVYAVAGFLLGHTAIYTWKRYG